MMDQLGRDVKMLANKISHAGQNEVAIDASTLANGSYFLRINAEGKTGVTRLQIAK
jgi:hypothetical protein